jgi:outer membrane protein assembly factor BamB
MAVDDGGHLFALAGGRMGDGVSGDDVPTGGVAAYDPSGQNIFAIPEDGNIARGAHGLAHGVILFGYEARAYDEGGTLLWKADRERDDAPAVRISGLGLELLEPMSEEMPLVAKRGPGSYFQLNAAVDGDGNRYFVHDQRVVSIDPELDVRWSVRVPGANGWNTPAIGPDGTVLVTSDDGHLTSID